MSPLNTLQPNWKWQPSGAGAGIFRLRIDTANLSGALEHTDTTYTPPRPITEGRHILYLQERDEAGNWSESASRPLILALRGNLSNTSAAIGKVTQGDIALVAGNDGTGILAHQNEGDGGGASMVKRFNGQGWEVLGDPSPFGKFRYGKSLALSMSGAPYMVLLDSLDRPTVVRYASSQWQPIGQSPLMAGGAGEVALALSRAGAPYIAFRDGANDGKASVLRWNGAEWENVGPKSISKGFSVFFRLYITSAGIPIVAYLDAGYTPAKIAIQRYNPSALVWDYVGEVPVHSASNQEFSIVLSREDSLFIALASSESGGAGEVYGFSGTDWKQLGESVFLSGDGYHPMLAIDSAGNKFVAYTEAEDITTVKMLVGEKWIPVGPRGFAPRLRSLTLSPAGVPWLTVGGVVSDANAVKASFDP